MVNAAALIIFLKCVKGEKRVFADCEKDLGARIKYLYRSLFKIPEAAAALDRDWETYL